MLKEYFESNKGRLIHKWMHYFEIYERHLERFRGREINMLEIGVSHGGSLQMWKHYLGDKAHIHGVDIADFCKTLEEDRVRIFIGDQADPAFLQSLKAQIPRVDILLDDGGHRMDQQIITFRELFDHITDDGVYICEDLHTSYWPEFGGGLRKPGTFIEFSKQLIDQLHAWHTRDAEQHEVDDFTLSAHSMHFYDSVLVIEKRRMVPPSSVMVGVPSFELPEQLVRK